MTTYTTIEDMQAALRKGQVTSVALVQSAYAHIKAKDSDIGAFLSLREAEALKEAQRVDEKIKAKGALGPLEGIPVALKDNICMKGLPATCASKMLEDFMPPYDAEVVKKLKEAGAIIIGKVNMDEFAMGSSTENSAFKKTKNPHDLRKVPGGSSGGSAAAVAGGFVPLALGSDTGGSIRQPASFCGVVGMKPTYGTVSRYGLIAFASSLDQIGPMTANVRDNALALSLLQGQDLKDPTTVRWDLDTDYLKDIDQGATGMRIGIPREFFEVEGLDPVIKASILSAVEVLKARGAQVEYFSLPITKASLSAYYILSSAEASTNLARYDGVRYGYRTKEYKDLNELMTRTRTEAFGEEVKRRIMLGTYVLSSGYYEAYYSRAKRLKNKIKATLAEAFEKYDLILGPTSPVLPFALGEKTKDPMAMYLADIYTVTVNIAGLPALSLPCGYSQEGLPIGLQLIGDYYKEGTLYKGAYALEQGLTLDQKGGEA